MGCSGSSASSTGTGVISVGTSTLFLPGSLSTPTRDLKVTPEDSFGETFEKDIFSGALFELSSLPPYVRDCGTFLPLKNDLDGFLYLTGRCFFSPFGFSIGFAGFLVLVLFFGGGAGVVVVAIGGANANGAAAGVVVTAGAVKLK